MIGSKYLNPSRAINPAKILLGASLAEKKAAGEDSSLCFLRKACKVMIAAKIIRMMEARRGKSPPPGALKDPRG